MRWLLWRQHRAETLALTIAVTVLITVLVILGRPMHALFPSGPAHCLTTTIDHGCRNAIMQLQQNHGYSTSLLVLLNLAPYLIGGFLGAPLLAREMETGTWQLAWTQTIPRLRWLVAKVAVLGAVSALLAAVLATVIAWYRQPLDLLGGFDITGFDLTGLVPMAYTLFAFALSVCAGLLLRRSLPAAAAAFVGFVALRVGIAGWIRPHYITPMTLNEPILPGSGEIPDGAPNPRDRILTQGFTDATGHHITGLDAAIMQGKAGETGADPTVYLHANGIQHWVVYQPIDRYWTFQLIETAIFVGLAAVLLAVVVWRLQRRAF